jgi:hypothetical protein
MKNNSILLTVLMLLVIAVSFIGGSAWHDASHDHGTGHHGPMMTTHGDDMEGQREIFLAMRDSIVGEQMSDRQYSCCLEKPCTYCIEKTPGHGKGATCSCLDDVMNGKHPCGECIGEILEGHGNPLISEYFATAISEEVGDQYKDTIKQIITDKYGILIEQHV